MHPARCLPAVVLLAACGACAGRSTPPRLPGSALPARTEPSKRPPVHTDSPIVRTALALEGTRYQAGGANRAGMDCSGLVQYVYAENGIALPRLVTEQFAVGKPVPLSKVQPGDLVFFSPKGPPTHVGIVVDRDTFVHAPKTSTVVRVDRLSNGYWTQQFAGARRVLGTVRPAR